MPRVNTTSENILDQLADGASFKELQTKFGYTKKDLLTAALFGVSELQGEYLALLKKYGKFSKNSIIVGDTETDILMGKHLVIKTIAVSSGMRNRKFLKKYKPDILIKDFSEIKNIINQ